MFGGDPICKAWESGPQLATLYPRAQAECRLLSVFRGMEQSRVTAKSTQSRSRHHQENEAGIWILGQEMGSKWGDESTHVNTLHTPKIQAAPQH